MFIRIVDMLLEYCRNHVAFLLPMEMKLKLAMFRNYQIKYFYLTLLLLLRFWNIPDLTLESRENHPADIIARNAAIKGTNSS